MFSHYKSALIKFIDAEEIQAESKEFVDTLREQKEVISLSEMAELILKEFKKIFEKNNLSTYFQDYANQFERIFQQAFANCPLLLQLVNKKMDAMRVTYWHQYIAEEKVDTISIALSAKEKQDLEDQSVSTLLSQPEVSADDLIKASEMIIDKRCNLPEKEWEKPLKRAYRKKILTLLNNASLSEPEIISQLQGLFNAQLLKNMSIRRLILEAYQEAAEHTFCEHLYSPSPLKDRLKRLIELRDQLPRIMLKAFVPITDDLMEDTVQNRHYKTSEALQTLFNKNIEKMYRKKINHLTCRRDLDFHSKLDKMEAIRKEIGSYQRQFSGTDSIAKITEQLFAFEPVPSSDALVETSRKLTEIEPFLLHIFNLFLSDNFDVTLQEDRVQVTELPSSPTTNASAEEKLILEQHAIVFNAWLIQGAGKPYQDDVKKFIQEIVPFLRKLSQDCQRPNSNTSTNSYRESDSYFITRYKDPWVSIFKTLTGTYNTLTSSSQFGSFFSNIFARHPRLDAAGNAFNTGHVIHAHKLLQKIISANFIQKYDLDVISNLPEGNEKRAVPGKIYLSAAGDYVIRDPKGTVQKGCLPNRIDLSFLSRPPVQWKFSLMSTPMTNNYETSHANHLYLYKDNNGIFFRYFNTQKNAYLRCYLDNSDEFNFFRCRSFHNQTYNNFEIPQNLKKSLFTLLSPPPRGLLAPLGLEDEALKKCVVSYLSDAYHAFIQVDFYKQEESREVEKWLTLQSEKQQKAIRQFGKAIQETLSLQQFRQYQTALCGIKGIPGLFQGYASGFFDRSKLFSAFLASHPEILDFFTQAFVDPSIAQTGVVYSTKCNRQQFGIHIVTDTLHSLDSSTRNIGDVFFWEEMDEHNKTIWRAGLIEEEKENGSKKLSCVGVPETSAFFAALSKGCVENKRLQAAQQNVTVASASSSEGFVEQPHGELITKLRCLLQTKEAFSLFGEEYRHSLLAPPLPTPTVTTLFSHSSKNKIMNDANAALRSARKP